MSTSQPGILAPVVPAARFVTLSLGDAPARAVLARLSTLVIDESLVVGIGEPLVRGLGHALPGLRSFPAIDAPAGAIPSTQAALFLQTRSHDHGESLSAMRRALADVGDGMCIEEDVMSFMHDTGRDLSGYEDGTENPTEDAAVTAAIVSGRGAGLDGGAFVAAQRWVHELAALERLNEAGRDAIVGRSRRTNEELEDAPPSAHVRRTAQEDFDPPAFMVRRSMPFGTVREHGLFFVAYVAALDTFERVLRRMAGIEDGLVDGLFSFSRPVSGGFYFCPPLDGSRLDLRAFG
jgi:putative iron-dependent peroxidase